ERAGDAEPDLERGLDGKRPVVEPLAEVATFEPLHRNEESIAEAPVLEVADDARVAELGEQPRFAHETRLGRPLRAHDLERDGLVPLAIEGAEHLSHAALAGQSFDDEASGDDVSDLHGARSLAQGSAAPPAGAENPANVALSARRRDRA